ncbi:ABC transporter permease [Lentzea sp. HUAS12]|uniref:ABC transporter permease n=1 Tax=Lentzea sp. HUAS12 TaxID=2951806 RepID=UPI0020A22BEE|nr:ABC transporter permease [Lentzea sp. HUAS12]USX55554.1 ABC transporter permease [Lentzea sp. HUAS12]
MTTTLPAPATRIRPQTLTRAVHSEWIKTRSLRSTWVGMAAVAVVMIGFGAIASAVSTGSVAPPGPGGSDGGGPFGGGGPLATVLTGSTFAVLLIGVLGSLAGAREYGSRMITASVVSVPRRWQVVVAKAVALSAAVVPTALIAVLGSYAVGTAIFSANDAPTASLTDDDVLTTLFGMVGYITAIALIGLGLGILLRSVAGSIGAVVGGILILPTIAGALLPDSWDTILRFLPSSAASAFTAVAAAGDSKLGAAAGVTVLAGWVAAALVAAVVSLSRRDV